MGNKLNIPTPTPAIFPLKLVGQENIIPYNPKLNPAEVNAGFLAAGGLSAASTFISEFLTKRFISEPAEPVKKPALNIPSVNDSMATVAGAALNGTPLFSNLEITGKSWTDFNKNSKSYADMVFNTVIITCQQQKNIVETQIQGSDDGAVIEYSGMNNYNVTINIVVVGNNNNGIYPQSDAEEIIKMLTSPVSVKVSSWYLLMLDIQELVIVDYTIGQVEGGISQQPITIQAKSIKNHTLVIQ